MRYAAIAFMFMAALSLSLLAGGCAGEGAALDPYEIRLAGNATTGYAWQYTMSAEGVVEELWNTYEQELDDDPDAVPALGRGGVYAFGFGPAGVGEVTLSFTYCPPWEPESVARTATYVLSCDGERVTLVSFEERDLLAEQAGG